MTLKVVIPHSPHAEWKKTFAAQMHALGLQTIKWDGEICHSCGHPYTTVWRAPDAIWQAVTGITDGSGLRCLNCFDAEAAIAGINIWWECSLEDFPTKNRGGAGDGDLREQLAALAHEQWSGWMEYMFSKCHPGQARLDDGTFVPNGTMVIPAWATERWMRQMSTPYAELPESEKESDRQEADRVLAIVSRAREEQP